MTRTCAILTVIAAAWIVGSFASHAQEMALAPDAIADILAPDTIANMANSPYDSTHIETSWVEELKHGHIDFEHKKIRYPKGIELGLDVYNWGNYVFNHYDSTYVGTPPKKWKLILKSTNFADTYHGHIAPDNYPLSAHSRLISNFGLRLSFMAVGFEYMVNLRDLFSGKKIKNKRLQYAFTCSRFNAELYYLKNSSETHLSHLGDYFDKSLVNNYNFNGFKREVYGIDFVYIFNHTHYAEAAAYCFSKIQRRSSGSLIAGLGVSHHDYVFDFTTLDEARVAYLPVGTTDCRFRYRDYSLLVGYGYTFVLPHRWIFNVTVTPAIGFRHSFPNSIEGMRNMVGTDIKGKTALVHNRGNFFYGLHFLSNGSWYWSRHNRFFYSRHDFNLTAGFRF